MKDSTKKIISIASSGLVLGAMAFTTNADAAVKSYTDLGNASELRSSLIEKSIKITTINDINSTFEAKCGEKTGEGKCGEGKCGDKKGKGKKKGKKGEGKCGEGKCGDKKGEGKCGDKKGEGKCGDKKGEGKCGEGKCGDKKGEGKCGEK